MAVAGGGAKRGGVTRWTRAALGLQVGLLVVLGLAATGLVIHVFDREGLRVRSDWTRDERNSLDDRTAELLAQLPERAEVDLFFQAPIRYLRPVWQETVDRARDLLLVARESSPQKLFLRENDVLDLPAVEGRLEALRVEAGALRTPTPYGADLLAAAVVSVGERRAVIRFVPEAADVDWGDPMRRAAPRLLEWRGEEALAEALAKVASDVRPKVYFSTGHAERDLRTFDGNFFYSLTFLADELEAEGYELATWDPNEEGPVPDDADALVVASPDEPFTDGAMTALRDYLGRGGRALVALGMRYEEDDPLMVLLGEHGMHERRGIVSQAVVNPTTGRPIEGEARCASLRIRGKDTSSSHPVTKRIWERDRTLEVTFSRSLDRGVAPDGGLLFDLVMTPVGTWRDLPAENGQPDFRYDGNREERGQFRLAMAATWPARSELGTKEGRLIGLPGASLLEDRTFAANREFAIAALDWLVDRDFRVRVPSRDPFRSKLDVQRDARVPALLAAVRFGLPGLCLVLGLVILVLRRRGA